MECEENHLNGGGVQINAGASENEMRKMSSRPSTMNSFQENGAQVEISYDVTGFQGLENFFDDGASCLLEFPLTDPPGTLWLS